MAPELVEEFVSAFNIEINRRRRDGDSARLAHERELATVQRKLTGLVDAISEGLRGPDLQARLNEHSARRDTLVRLLEESAAPPVRLHPSLAEVYRKKVGELQEALKDPTIRAEAITILQGLIERVIIHSSEGSQEIEIVGEIARMVELGIGQANSKLAALDPRAASSVKVVAGIGFEPMTFRL